MQLNNTTLKAFVAAVKDYGTSRDNQYQIQLVIPTYFLKAGKGNADTISKMFTVFAQSASIPPRNINTTPYRIEHAHFEIPYGISYEPISITFILDRNMLLREFFTAWHALIYKSDNGMEFYNDYVGNVMISSLDKGLAAGESTYDTMLINAYPKSIGDVQYSSSGQGEVIMMAVQFVYEQMEELSNKAKKANIKDLYEDDIPDGVVTVGPEEWERAGSGHATTLNEPGQKASPAFDGYRGEIIPEVAFGSVKNETSTNNSSYYDQDAVERPLITVFDQIGDSALYEQETGVRSKIVQPKPDLYKKNN